MMTIFAMFAFRGRDRDNPSMRTRSTANFEQRMEIVGGGGCTCTITSVAKDNMVVEVYEAPHVRVRGAETATTGLKVNT